MPFIPKRKRLTPPPFLVPSPPDSPQGIALFSLDLTLIARLASLLFISILLLFILAYSHIIPQPFTFLAATPDTAAGHLLLPVPAPSLCPTPKPDPSPPLPPKYVYALGDSSHSHCSSLPIAWDTPPLNTATPDPADASLPSLEAAAKLLPVACGGGQGWSGVGRQGPLSRFLARVGDAGAGVVLAMGGSATAGCNCNSPLQPFIGGDGKACRNVECAWSGRVADALRASLPLGISTYITHTSVALGGTTIGVGLLDLAQTLSNVPSGVPGLLLVDYTVNDSVFQGGTPEEQDAQYETFIQRALQAEKEHNVTLALLATCALPNCARINALVRALAALYSVPLLDYAFLVDTAVERGGGAGGAPVQRAHLYTDPSTGGGHMWHPLWPVHSLISRAFMGCVRKSWEGECGTTTGNSGGSGGSGGSSGGVSPCATPEVRYTAAGEVVGGVAGKVVGKGGVGPFSWETTPPGSWSVAEDSAGKPGWISLVVGGRLEFEVRFGVLAGGVGGDISKFSVVYLKTYGGIGAVSVSLEGPGGEVVKGASDLILDGANAPDASGAVAKSSQTYVYTGEVLKQWPGATANVNYTLVFTVREGGPPKFKVTEVQAC